MFLFIYYKIIVLFSGVCSSNVKLPSLWLWHIALLQTLRALLLAWM